MTSEQLERGMKIQRRMKNIEREIDHYQSDDIEVLFLAHANSEVNLIISDNQIIKSILTTALTHKCKEFNKLKKELEEL